MCGGTTRVIPSQATTAAKRTAPSGFCALFDCARGELLILSEMNVARYNHGICFLDNEVYCLGGIT